MVGISRKTLQWQSISIIFIGSLLSGLLALSIAAYLVYSHLDAPLTTADLLLYFGLTGALLIIFAGLCAVFAYLRFGRPLEALEQITFALPLLSAKKYQEAQ
ncbi:MAG: GGDEF domain-containing protein, partial [Methylophaga sp.]